MPNMLDTILEKLAKGAEAFRLEREAILEEARASVRSLETESRIRSSGFRMYREKEGE